MCAGNDEYVTRVGVRSSNQKGEGTRSIKIIYFRSKQLLAAGATRAQAKITENPLACTFPC